MQTPDFALLLELLAKARSRTAGPRRRQAVSVRTQHAVDRDHTNQEGRGRRPQGQRTEIGRQIHWTETGARLLRGVRRMVPTTRRRNERYRHFAMQMPLRLASACLPMARRAVLDPVGFGRFTDADSTTSRRVAWNRTRNSSKLRVRLPEGRRHEIRLSSWRSLNTAPASRRACCSPFPGQPLLPRRPARRRFQVAVMHGGVNRDDAPTDHGGLPCRCVRLRPGESCCQ